VRSLLPATAGPKSKPSFLAGRRTCRPRVAALPGGSAPTIPSFARSLSLLRHDAAQEPPSSTPSTPARQHSRARPPPGRILGPYRLEREIGRAAWPSSTRRAAPDGEFQKRVAVKIIKRGMDIRTVSQRLPPRAAHPCALAHLHRPPARRGTTSDGRPWIAMDLHRTACPSNRFCGRAPPQREERCRLIGTRSGDAVAYAHRHLVVHRDLSPLTSRHATHSQTARLRHRQGCWTEDDGGFREP